ncbi:16066_t:CDS:1, partial [Gigaspora margarita]
MANLQQWLNTLIAKKNLLLIKFDDLEQLTFINRGAFEKYIRCKFKAMEK